MTPTRSVTARLALAAGCLFLSGTGSLVLEVVWTRELRLVFGSSTLAATTVLVAYMLGLGLGGWLGGKRAARLRNGARAYGLLELAVALLALGVPYAFDQYPALHRALFGELSLWSAALLRFGLALAVTLIPTLLMGATLPLLVAAIVRDDSVVGRHVGLLYGINTAGAVCGVFLATFGLFPSFGLRGTNAFGAGLDALAGAIALLALARAVPDAPPASAGSEPADTGSRRLPLALLAYGIVGFTALAYEVAWVRALSMVLGSSIYAFASMLAAFLLGIAAGSLVARRRVDRLERPESHYAAGIAALGVAALLTTWVLGTLPDLFLWITDRVGQSPRTLPFVQVGIAILVMLPPTLLLGALFPLLVRILAARVDDAPVTVGQVYFGNTLGSALGAFTAGFVLIPWLGVAGTLAACAALNVATALALGLRLPRATHGLRAGMAVAALAVLAAALVMPRAWRSESLTRGVFFRSPVDRHHDIETFPLEGVPEAELLYYRDGLSTTVSVHAHAGASYLRVNGKTDAGSAADMPNQVLIGQIPLLFGGPTEDVLVIGLGSGVSVGSVLTHDVSRVDCVELEPAMAEASRFFDDVNGRPLEDPRTRLIAEDARAWLSYTDRRYDVIVSMPPNPWMTGVSNLFTREFFQSVRSRLEPGGRLLQWVQLYGMDERGFRSLLATLGEQFPSVYGFTPRHGSGDVLLVATLAPLRADQLPDWSRLPEAVREDLRRVGLYSTADLHSLIRFGPRDLPVLTGRDPRINTDANMFIELRAPWTLYEDTIDANWRLLAQAPNAAAGVLDQAGVPLDAEALGALAIAYLQGREDAVSASRLYERSLALGPSANALALFAQLTAERSPELVPSLADELERALPTLEPTAPSQMVYADLTWRAGADLGAALAASERALELSPRDPDAQTLRAVILRQLGRVDESVAAFQDVMARPYARLRIDVWLEYARSQLAAGDVAGGRETLERYLGSAPNSPSAWELMAQVERHRGDAAAAERCERNAHLAARNRARILHRHARQALEVGARQQAVSMLRQALEWDPEYQAARTELALLGVTS